MPRPIDILVYGATGYTGRLVLAQLQGQAKSFAIAGRPGAALAELGRQHGVAAFEADLTQRARLAEAFAQATVVLACAGPYAETGDALFDAALQARSHLLDLSGEAAHLRRSLARSDTARAAGIAVVHAVGFDVVPSELLASLCRRPLGDLAWVELATAHHRGQESRGTLRSHLLALDRPSEAASPQRRIISFAPPLGPRIAHRVDSAESVLLPRSLGVSTLRHYLGSLSPAALAMAENAALPHSPKSLRRSLQQLEAAGLDGPHPAAREANRFFIRCRAQGRDGRSRSMSMTGPDAYGLSARLAAACARSAASPHFERRGVLSPLEAFEPLPLLALMARAGVRWGASTEQPEPFQELR